MYTQPSGELEGTARGREAQALLRNCVHCGFCLPACPTYRVTGNELDSPRGRIYLIKELVEGAEASETTRRHLDRCLTCRACETACPSGVEYGRLVDVGRELADDRAPRPATERVLRRVLAATLSRRGVVSVLVTVGRALLPVLPLFLRSRIPPRSDAPVLESDSARARTIVLLEGCVQPGLAPSINLAAARVLDRLGISTIRLAGETCCGALHHHLGMTSRALDRVRRNVDACAAALDAGAEAIVSTASACGLMVKDYARLLANDATYAERARRVSAATVDLSEVVEPADLALIVSSSRTAVATRTEPAGARSDAPPRPRVAWQSPCTLQHGQRIGRRVESLLAAAGFDLVPAREATLCCGSAGTYSILQPQLSRELRDRKLAALLEGSPAVIATANIGCLEHLRGASPVPVRHWIELVAEQLEPSCGEPHVQ
jgi:glycolate oxidase iron-sulfur subunit